MMQNTDIILIIQKKFFFRNARFYNLYCHIYLSAWQAMKKNASKEKSHGTKKTAIVLIFFENKSKCFPLLFIQCACVCVWYSVASVCGSVYATAHGEQLYAIIYMITRNYLS